MDSLRFFYNGKNLDEGKKYFKPSSEYTHNNLQDITNHYKTFLEYDKDNATKTHPAKCPAMNSIKVAGWTMFNHYELTESDASPVIDLFPNYPNASDYVLLRFKGLWSANIPTGCYLTTIPTLYHTGNWFSLPGIIDSAFQGSFRTIQLNSFIFMKKGEVIPKDSPIAQWTFTKKEIPNVIIELANEYDTFSMFEKDYLRELKSKDYQKYKLIRNSDLLKELWED